MELARITEIINEAMKKASYSIPPRSDLNETTAYLIGVETAFANILIGFAAAIEEGKNNE